jgi:adenylate cyclase
MRPGSLAVIAAGYALAVLLAAFSWSLPGLVDVERLAYDMRLALASQRVAQDPRIVLITFDEDTVAATRHRAPLDRGVLAAAVSRLDALSPRAIGVDILLDQPTNPTDDAALVAAFGALRTPFFVADDSAGGEGLLKPWQHDTLQDFIRRFGPGPGPRRSAAAALFADSDGVVRRGAPRTAFTLAEALAGTVGAPAGRGDVAIDYRRPADPDQPVFARLPILVLAQASPEALAAIRSSVAGRVVLIGAELDNEDRHRTPLSGQAGHPTAGIEIHAETLATLLDRRPPDPLFPILSWTLVIVAPLLGVAVGWLRLGAFWRVAIVVGTTTAVGAAAFAWELLPGVQTLGLPIFGPALGWLLMTLLAGAVSTAATNEERQLAREIGRRYLPPDVAQAIERRPELLEVHGRRVPLAIVFTDLAGFTTLSETLAPEALSEVLNSYLDGMTEVAQRHGATLDKFIGDAVVCFWGAPLADPQAASRAIEAALAMQAFAREHQAAMAERGVAIGVTRIGAHYGEAVVGNFGSRRRVQYTAMGDAMNLAARLESANKQVGTQVLASGDLIAAAGWTRARDLGAVAVKGRGGACRIFQLDDRLSEAAAEAHRTWLESLRSGAATAGQLLAQAGDDEALAEFARRIAKVGVDGVWTLESK